MLAAYRAQDWDAAEHAVYNIALLADEFAFSKLVAVFRDRIIAYRAAPPPRDWDGVYQALSK